MIRQVVLLTVTWMALMALAGGEFIVSGLQLAPSNRPLVFPFAFAMMALIALVFMRLRNAPLLAKGFAVMAVFWLIVLFGLGTMDALTRSWFPVIGYNPM